MSINESVSGLGDGSGQKRRWVKPQVVEVWDRLAPRTGVAPAPYESDGFSSPSRTTPFPGYTNTLPPVYPTS